MARYKEKPPDHTHHSGCDKFTLNCFKTVHKHNKSCENKAGERTCGVSQEHTHLAAGYNPCWRHEYKCGYL